eukprot:3260834-Prymnesium_polylepis.1
MNSTVWLLALIARRRLTLLTAAGLLSRVPSADRQTPFGRKWALVSAPLHIRIMSANSRGQPPGLPTPGPKRCSVK